MDSQVTSRRDPISGPEGDSAGTTASDAKPAGISDPESQSAQTSTSEPESPTTAPDVPQSMPNYIGGSYDDAYQYLSQYGVRISQESRIAPQAAGTVIEQDPVGGAPFPANVTLVVAVQPPKVPNVIGETFGTAEQLLTSMGFSVVELPEFDEERVDGLVVGQDPPEGADNAGQVTLTVVRRPGGLFISCVEE